MYNPVDQHTKSVYNPVDQHTKSVYNPVDQHTKGLYNPVDQHTKSVYNTVDQHTKSVYNTVDQIQECTTQPVAETDPEGMMDSCLQPVWRINKAMYCENYRLGMQFKKCFS